jgi:hypothetical protein
LEETNISLLFKLESDKIKIQSKEHIQKYKKLQHLFCVLVEENAQKETYSIV